MTHQEGLTELSNRLNISYTNLSTNDLYSTIMLSGWLNLAVQRAWDYAAWAFSEKAEYTTTVASQEYYDYPDDFISDSIMFLKVLDDEGDMKTYDKIRYEDYMKYREDNDEGEEKLWSSYRRFYFINPLSFDNAAGRTIEIWGRERAPRLNLLGDKLPFSPDSDNYEDSGNEAIIKLAYSIALASDKKKDTARSKTEEAGAYAILDVLAKRESGEQSKYQTLNTPMWDNPQII